MIFKTPKEPRSAVRILGVSVATVDSASKLAFEISTFSLQKSFECRNLKRELVPQKELFVDKMIKTTACNIVKFQTINKF